MSPILKKLFVLSSISVLLVICSANAKADPYLIQSGSVTASGISGNSTFVFAVGGSNASMSALTSTSGGSIAASQCFAGGPCIPGFSVNLSSNTGALAPSDFPSSGTVVLNGQTYFISSGLGPLPPFPGLAVTGSASFTAGSVIIPVSDAPTVTLTAPFTMDSHWIGRWDSGNIFFDFSGSGTATLVLNRVASKEGDPTYSLQSVTYNFSPTAVPEPATMIMLGTGLASVGLKAIMKRRRAHRRS